MKNYSYFIIILFLILFNESVYAQTNSRSAIIEQIKKENLDKNYEKSENLYLDILNNNPEDIEAMIGLATVYAWQKKYNQSLKILKKILKIKPENLEASLILYRIKSWEKKYQEALDGYEQLLQKHPKNLTLLKDYSKSAKWSDNWNLVLKLNNKIIEFEPENDLALFDIGLAYYHLKQYNQAIHYGNLSLEKNPNQNKLHSLIESWKIENKNKNIANWIKRAQENIEKGNFELAITIYKKALSAKPNNLELEIAIIRLKSFQGNHEEAISDGIKLLKNNPQNIDLLILLGRVSGWMKIFSKSVSFYEKALEIKPNDIETLTGLALTYKWMGEYEKSNSLYENILSQNPNNIDILIDISSNYAQQSNYKKAIYYLERAKIIDPDRADIRGLLGKYYGWTDQLDEAITELQKTVALSQGNIDSYISLGRVFNWKNKQKEAIKWYEQAINKNPNNADAWIELGKSYIYAEDWNKAKETFDEGRKLIPHDPRFKKELENLEQLKSPEISLQYQFFNVRSHDSESGQLDTVFVDHRETLNYFHHFSAKTNFQLRYQRSDAKEKNIKTDSTNYNIASNIASIGLDQKLPEDFRFRFRYDLVYLNNKNSTNSPLPKTEIDHTGFAFISKEWNQHLVLLSFGRELFIRPIPGTSFIESINTYSLSYDFSFNSYLSVLLSPSLRDFSTPVDKRQSYIFRPRLKLPFLKQVTLEYEFEYETSPEEFNHSVFINFQEKIGEKISFETQYGMTHHDFVNSYEHQFETFISYQINEKINWNFDGKISFGIVHSRDIIHDYQTSLNFKF